MEKFIIQGGKKLQGTVSVSGAKNVSLKTLVAACLTDEEVIIHNIPLLSDVYVMIAIIKELGGTVDIKDHTAKIQMKVIKKNKISLDEAAQTRTASMFIAPLLARNGHAVIPNPGGCRIGARPIDRTIDGLKQMGAEIDYKSEDGFFHARIVTNQSDKQTEKRLHAVNYRFDKNTHTGTETLLLAAIFAEGKTTLENAAQEPEVDELIAMLNSMGAQITRTSSRTIEIIGVKKLHGTEITIAPDRNEIVTFAVAAIATKGDVIVEGAKKEGLVEFLEELEKVHAGYEITNTGIRFFYQGALVATSVVTKPYPGFMTDWQAPWAVLMTQAIGVSTIHETVFENRFGYVQELKKMGAEIMMYNPKIDDPEKVYNFNIEDENGKFHALQIKGPSILHNAVVKISDLRAGATLIIAALVAEGESSIHGIQYVHRGYEAFDERLRKLGANIERVIHET